MDTADLGVGSVATGVFEVIDDMWQLILVYLAFAAVADGAVAVLQVIAPRLLTLPIEFVVAIAKTWLLFGLGIGALRVLRGESSRPIDLIIDRALFIRGFVVSLVVFVAAGTGLLLLVVPGVFLWLFWSQSLWLVLDGKARLFDALPRSVFLVNGAKTPILLNLLVFALVAALAVIPVAFVYFLLGKWLGTGMVWLWANAGSVCFTCMAAVMYDRLIQWKPPVLSAQAQAA